MVGWAWTQYEDRIKINFATVAVLVTIDLSTHPCSKKKKS